MRRANVQRLKTRAQFQATLAGATVAKTAHFALHRASLPALQPDTEPLFGTLDVWLGAMVPKRWARRAVTRNTIKRQVYAVASLFEAQLPAAAHVVRLRQAFDRSRFKSATSEPLKQAVRAEIMQLLKHAGVTPPAGTAR